MNPTGTFMLGRAIRWASSGKMIWRALRFISVLAALIFLAYTVDAGNGQLDLNAGNHKLGESLSLFKESFPLAACGAASRNDPGRIVCCVNDPKEASSFSAFPILILDNCRVHADFKKEKLHGIFYTVHLSNIEDLLPDFEKAYGPPHEVVLSSMFSSQVGTAAWFFYVGHVDLTLGIIPGEALRDDPAVDTNIRKVLAVQVSISGDSHR